MNSLSQFENRDATLIIHIFQIKKDNIVKKNNLTSNNN